MSYLFQWFGIVAALISMASPILAATKPSDRDTTISAHPLSPILIGQNNADAFEYEDFDFWADQCLLLSQEDLYEEALSSCEQAISLKPKRENVELWLARGDALFHLGRYTESLLSYNFVTEASPNNSLAITQQCAVLFQLERYDDAIDECERALRINGDWGDSSPGFAWYYRGLALQKLGRLETALASFRQALVINPEDPLALAECLKASSELGSPDDAVASCRTRETITPDAAEPLQTSKTREQALLETVDLYEQAIAANPHDVTLWIQQGLALERLGLNQRALISYNQAIALNPQSSLALAYQCGVFNQLENYEAALASCNEAFQGNKRWGSLGSAYVWSQHSDALLGLGRLADALASADRAVAIDSAYAPVAWAQRSVVLLNLGRYDDALASADTAVELDPNSASAHNSRAVSLWRLQQYQEAVEVIHQAIQLYELARQQLGRSATDTFERTVYAEPLILQYRGHILALFNRGRILSSLGDYETAVQSYAQALAMHEELMQNGVNALNNALLAEIWLNQGVAYSHFDLENAATSTIQATTLDQTLFEGWYNQGVILNRQGQYEQALQAYNAANRLKPNNVDVLTGRGMALEGLGKLPEAIAVYDQVLNIDPGYALARQRLQVLVNTAN